MDFFEAQARAKKRSARLVVLFALAVVGTILAAYVAGVMLARGTLSTGADVEINGQMWSAADLDGWWHPRLFFGIAGATFVVVGLGSLFKWLQYSTGGSVVAESLGGRRIEPGAANPAERRLLNVVEEMAIASGTPVPAVYVLDDEPAINAFAAGLTTSDAVVAVTRGTLEKLNRDELQGVVGHEFSHILNGDMRLNMRLTALIFGILVIGIMGRTVLRGMRHVRVGRGKEKGGSALALLGVGLALMIVGYLGYFFGRLIQAAVSRQREFLADASAVQFTRNPAGITGALKKIGGYALGGKMQSAHSTEIGHFFFAQAFGSFFGGLWATHPPLPERIRAIDPNFDGAFFEPPEQVDVARESFVSAGLAPARPAQRAATSVPPVLPPAAATAALAAAGTLTAEQIAHAQTLVDGIPAGLREAARQPENVAALLYGLLLADDPAARAGQRRFAAARAPEGKNPLAQLDALEPWLRRLPAAGRLPLVQLALPAVRRLPQAELDALVDTLDELVHADGTVTVFEFALQKLLLRTLELGRNPGAAIVSFQSFVPLAGDLSVLLSALARAASVAPAEAPAAFAAGAAHLPLVRAQLAFVPAADLAALDRALDRLAGASPAIKQAALTAAATVIGHDGRIEVTEAELLRAVAAALDCPMPPLRAA